MLEAVVVIALEGFSKEEGVVSIDSVWKVKDDVVGDGSTSVSLSCAFDWVDSLLLEGEISVGSLENVVTVVKKKTELGRRLLVS